MRRTVKAISFLMVIGLLAPTVHAEAPAWNLDRAHSGVYFGIQHIYSTVRGSFDAFTADIRFNPKDLGGSRFDFTVSVKSVDTKNPKRDRHLMSGDFFNEKKYPKMTFRSAAIQHVQGDRYTVSGTMTIKDVRQDVTVPFIYFGSKPNPFKPKQQVAGFEAEFTIDRLSYGVGSGKFLKMGVVGKDVTILVAVEATR